MLNYYKTAFRRLTVSPELKARKTPSDKQHKIVKRSVKTKMRIFNFA